MSDTSSPNAPVTLPEEMEKLIRKMRGAGYAYGRAATTDLDTADEAAHDVDVAEAALRSAIAEISRERDEYRHARDTLALDYAADKALVRSAESRLREVERERAEANEKLHEYRGVIDLAAGKDRDQQSRIRELEEALRNLVGHSYHSVTCGSRHGTGRCDCGIAAAANDALNLLSPTSTETGNER